MRWTRRRAWNPGCIRERQGTAPQCPPQNHKQFSEPVGRKDVTSPLRSQARAWPSPAVDVGRRLWCAAQAASSTVWRGQGHAKATRDKIKVSAVQCFAALRTRCNEFRARRDAGRPGPDKKRSAPPNASAQCRFRGSEGWWWWRNGKCGRWMELEKRGADDGLGLAEPDSPIPRFQLFPSFSLGPLWPSRFPTCPVALILSVAFRHRLGRPQPAVGSWLVARGSWTPFVFLSVSVCSTAAAVALTRAARDMGRPTDTPPNSGAFPRLTRFDGARDGVLGSIVQTRSPSIQRQTVRRPGKEVGRRQPSCNREAPNDRGNEACGGKGSGERGVLVGRQRSPGPGLVMSSRYMLRGISHLPGARLPS